MKKIPQDRLLELRNRLDLFPKYDPERKKIIEGFGELYGVSKSSVYRALRSIRKPRGLHRSDAGIPRVMPISEMERYCQIIAAMKLRTLNKQSRHLSTSEAIRLLETVGIVINDSLVKAPESVLKKTTVNRYLKDWGYSVKALQVEPVAVRFQASHANDCWQFDLSHSDLKTLEEWPDWIDAKKGRPILMLYNVVDDRSGVSYQEYHVTYGEDVEAALRFLFNAMTAKDIDGFPFHGRPLMLYMDNGPIAKSAVFQRVMEYLDIKIQTHLPRGKSGRKTTSRSKGKCERPFRTIKELHETLYHFHKPQNEKEANEWLLNYILRYNEKQHRSEPHSRIEDWIKTLPAAGIRQMCTWERFCSFAREPEKRIVGTDAKIKVGGGEYQVDHELAGLDVILLWGLFDKELFVEFDGKHYGPYQPYGGPIPLHRYRSYKRTVAEKRADAIEKLASELYLPKEALTQDTRHMEALQRTLPDKTELISFEDPDPFDEFTYPNAIQAKMAIADYLGIPLAKLEKDDIDKINEILAKTLNKKEVIRNIRSIFRPKYKGGTHVKRNDESL